MLQNTDLGFSRNRQRRVKGSSRRQTYNLPSWYKPARHESLLQLIGPHFVLGCTVVVEEISGDKRQTVCSCLKHETLLTALTTYSFILQFLQGHTDRVSCVAVSRSGRYLASGQVTHQGYRADVIVWDFETRSLLHRLSLHQVASDPCCSSRLRTDL